MQVIRLHKQAGVSYQPHAPKLYTVTARGYEVGTIEQSMCLSHWRVLDRSCQTLSRHSTIKAAVRAAKRVLA